jgi:hypothetical protein
MHASFDPFRHMEMPAIPRWSKAALVWAFAVHAALLWMVQDNNSTPTPLHSSDAVMYPWIAPITPVVTRPPQTAPTVQAPKPVPAPVPAPVATPTPRNAITEPVVAPTPEPVQAPVAESVPAQPDAPIDLVRLPPVKEVTPPQPPPQPPPATPPEPVQAALPAAPTPPPAIAPPAIPSTAITVTEKPAPTATAAAGESRNPANAGTATPSTASTGTGAGGDGTQGLNLNVPSSMLRNPPRQRSAAEMANDQLNGDGSRNRLGESVQSATKPECFGKESGARYGLLAPVLGAVQAVRDKCK